MRSGSEEDLSIQDEEASLLMRSEDFDFDNRSKCRSIARRIFTWTNLFLVTFLLLQAGILFLQKKVSQRMYNYPFVLTISQPICTTILFGLLTLTNHVYNMLKTKKAAQINVAEYYDTGDYTVPFVLFLTSYLNSDKIRSIRIKKQKTPIYRLLILGGLIILSNFLAYCGSRGNLVPGPVVVLLQQLVVPVTLVLSIIFLKTRYKLWHYLGAAFILTGIFIVLWPKLADADFTDNAIWAMLLLIVSSIPMSSAIVYMEHALKNTKLGIFYMWMWVNIFEFIVAVPLVFAIVPIQGIPISETWTNIVNGYKCLIENEPTLPEDQCDIVGWIYVVFMVILVLGRINQAFLIRTKSSALMWVAATSAVPLAEIAFTIPWLSMGSKTEEFNSFIIGGLVAVVVGLVLFRIVKERKLQTAPRQT